MPDALTAPAEIAPAADRAAVLAEVAALAGRGALSRQGTFSAYVATAQEIPHLLHEIGRQRETAFRAVGEGTGQALDLDRFDRHYLHLFVWDQAREQLAGAYRLTRTVPVLAEYGPEGLYTSTLFQFTAEFLATITPGLELGRSFVVSSYQRSPVPLALLWQGIGAYLARHPECVKLFGPVSISGDYSALSRHLMVEFLRRRHPGGALPGGITPRHPWPDRVAVDLPAELPPELDSLRAVCASISLLEGGAKGMPELLKHYLRLNARLLAFNVDPDFSHCLDALLLVDLRDVPAAFQKRFLGYG